MYIQPRFETFYNFKRKYEFYLYYFELINTYFSKAISFIRCLLVPQNLWADFEPLPLYRSTGAL